MSKEAKQAWLDYAKKQYELNVGKARAANKRAAFFASMLAEMGVDVRGGAK